MAGKPKEWEWALSEGINGHGTEPHSPEADRILWGQPQKPERTSCTAMKILVLGAEINLLLL